MIKTLLWQQKVTSLNLPRRKIDFGVSIARRPNTQMKLAGQSMGSQLIRSILEAKKFAVIWPTLTCMTKRRTLRPIPSARNKWN